MNSDSPDSASPDSASSDSFPSDSATPASGSLPFGSWPSPLAAADIAGGAKRLSGLSWRNGQLWWAEARPSEVGRVALVRSIDRAEPTDVLGAGWSARSLVHEYGGGAWWLGAPESTNAYFVNAEDQRIYSLDSALAAGSTSTSAKAPEPKPVTPESGSAHSIRFSDGRQHPSGAGLVAVRETHPASAHHNTETSAAGSAASEGSDAERPGEPLNDIVIVPLGNADTVPAPLAVASGADFYAAPRFSADGRFLSWIQWNHPQMPWDGTELFVAEVNLDEPEEQPLKVGEPIKVAGGANTAIVGPDWTSSGQLVYSDDGDGFWNLHAYDPECASVRPLTALMGAEIGAPAWSFGVQQWVELAGGDLAVIVTNSAVDSLALLATGEASGQTSTAAGLSAAVELGQMKLIDLPYRRIDALAAGAAGELYLTASSPESLPEVALLTNLSSLGAHVAEDEVEVEVLYRPAGRPMSAAWVSTAQHIEFPVGSATAHAFYYPPTGVVDGDVAEGVDGELPPLIVMGHGGPTSHSAPTLSLKVQYWTSRGFAVAEVNYRGSTGFGREYQRLLQGRWGIVDVEDCVAVAQFAVEQGLVDESRIAIRGGSAGGFTVLRALQTSEVFAAGTSLYGVADLEALAADTHKFESRYLDGLIGPYPERRDVYIERSPISHTDSLNCPLLVLQGSEDRVVPPSQSEAIVAAVNAKGLPHAYVCFDGEQHGFRQEASIVRSFEIELWFYSQIFGFQAADALEPPPEAVGFDAASRRS